MALDVQRHLDNQPILARAPSTVYRLHKFVKRHRSQAIAVLIVSVLLVTLMIVILMWNQNRLKVAKAESMRHESILSATRLLFYSKEDSVAAIRKVRLILDSKHIGYEAQLLQNNILANAREQISHYTSMIEADPQNANYYLCRARYYYCLDGKEKTLADLDKYRAILNPPKGTDAYDEWFKAVISQETPSGIFFGNPEDLGPAINLVADYEWFPRLSADGLSLFFIRNLDRWERWMAKRGTQNDLWVTAVRLTIPGETTEREPWNPASIQLEKVSLPTIFATFGIMPGLTTMDGLELYGWDARLGGYGSADIFVMKRKTLDSAWTDPCNIGPVVNTQYTEMLSSISPDGLELFFCDSELIRPGGCGSGDLWVTRRATRDDLWQEPENIGPQVNSPDNDSRPHIFSDGLMLFFDSNRSGGYRGSDLYVTRRKTLSDPWGKAVNLGPRVNAAGSEYNPCISADGHTLFFVRNEDLWQVSIITIESKADPNSLIPSAGQLRQSDSVEEVVH